MILRSKGWRAIAGILLTVTALYVLPSLDALSPGPGVQAASVFQIGRAGSPMATLPEEAPQTVSVMVHTVAPGDTINMIARLYGVDPRQIAAHNGIRNPDRIFPGQTLRIPDVRTQTYTVKRGDTLSLIAQQLGVDLQELIMVNGITNPNLIRVGEQLTIPGLVELGDIRVASAARRMPSYGMAWPVSGPISSSFGYRWGQLHVGIDIAAPYGRSVTACLDGTVTYAGRRGSYGNLVIIDHGNSVSSYYAHLSHIDVEVGMQVYKGELVGRVGTSGKSTGPHLHFEVRLGDRPVNPRTFLP